MILVILFLDKYFIVMKNWNRWYVIFLFCWNYYLNKLTWAVRKIFFRRTDFSHILRQVTDRLTSKRPQIMNNSMCGVVLCYFPELILKSKLPNKNLPSCCIPDLCIVCLRASFLSLSQCNQDNFSCRIYRTENYFVSALILSIF